MIHALREETFQSMGEGGMPDVVEKGRDPDQVAETLPFAWWGQEGFRRLVNKVVKETPCQMHDSEGMGKSCMGGSGKDQVRQAEL